MENKTDNEGPQWTDGEKPVPDKSLGRRQYFLVKLSDGDVAKARYDFMKHLWIKHSTHDVVAWKTIEKRVPMVPFGKEWTDDLMTKPKEELVEYIKRLLKANLARKNRR